MWEHALGIRLCQGFPVGVCHLPLCLVLTVPDITASDTHTHTHTLCILPVIILFYCRRCCCCCYCCCGGTKLRRGGHKPLKAGVFILLPQDSWFCSQEERKSTLTVFISYQFSLEFYMALLGIKILYYPTGRCLPDIP